MRALGTGVLAHYCNRDIDAVALADATKRRAENEDQHERHAEHDEERGTIPKQRLHVLDGYVDQARHLSPAGSCR